jgi:ferrous iron transport protein A
MQINLAGLSIGNTAVVKGFTNTEISLKLIELGCIPGAEVKMLRRAPFGDPVACACSGSIISIRLREAATVLIESA